MRSCDHARVVDFGRLAAAQLLTRLVFVRIDKVAGIIAEVVVSRQLGELLCRGGPSTGPLCSSSFDDPGGILSLLLGEHGMAQSRALRVLGVVVGGIGLTVI